MIVQIPRGLRDRLEAVEEAVASGGGTDYQVDGVGGGGPSPLRTNISFENATVEDDEEFDYTYVTVNLSQRQSRNAYAAGIASGASVDMDVNSHNYSGWLFLGVNVDQAMRVRVYGSDAARDADAARPIGEDPTGEHGLILELVLDAATDWTLAPPAAGFNPLPTDSQFYVRITNLAALGDVSATFAYVPLEAKAAGG